MELISIVNSFTSSILSVDATVSNIGAYSLKTILNLIFPDQKLLNNDRPVQRHCSVEVHNHQFTNPLESLVNALSLIPLPDNLLVSIHR